MESILNSIKKLCGIVPDYEHFDADMVMYINSVFVILNQMGVGPDVPFSITDESITWDQFSDDPAVIGLVKPYMGMKVRLMFDTSGLPSSVIESLNKQVAEYEWRLNVSVDPGGKNNE